MWFLETTASDDPREQTYIPSEVQGDSAGDRSIIPLVPIETRAQNGSNGQHNIEPSPSQQRNGRTGGETGRAIWLP